jgi:hypothetical protein
MGIVKVIPYVNRLAKVVSMPGGKRVGDAVADANANLLTIKEPCLEALDAILARIREIGATGNPGAPVLEEIYERANEAVGLAGVFGLPDLGKAAYSLCELIDSRPAGEGCSRQALDVHIDSLRLLRLGDAVPAAERDNMVAGLIAVVSHAKRTARTTAS